MERGLLKTYLQDHHSAITAELRVIRRMLQQPDNRTLAPALRELARGVERDQGWVRVALRQVNAGPALGKQLFALAAERIGSFKPNQRLWSYSPLSRLLELEGLRAAAEWRIALWQTIRRVQAHDGTLTSIDAERAQADAVGQRRALTELHQQAIRAFTGAEEDDDRKEGAAAGKTEKTEQLPHHATDGDRAPATGGAQPHRAHADAGSPRG